QAYSSQHDDYRSTQCCRTAFVRLRTREPRHTDDIDPDPASNEQFCRTISHHELMTRHCDHAHAKQYVQKATDPHSDWSQRSSLEKTIIENNRAREQSRKKPAPPRHGSN